MRALAVLALALLTNPAAAQAPAAPLTPAALAAARVDDLLAKLAAAPDAEVAKALGRQVERLWGRSGSDTADLLAARAEQAMQSGAPEVAVELLDRVIALEPGWAEGWNRRATAFFLLGDTTRAGLDLAETLAREPRHFGALAGLGAVSERRGDERRALDAYRRALAVHPHLDPVTKNIERLSPRVDGTTL